MGVSEDCPNFFGYPLLSQERVKLRTSNFVCTFITSIGTEIITNFGISSRGLTQGVGVSKIFRTPMHRAHRAVIFAVAQLSCAIVAATGSCIRWQQKFS